MLQRAMPGSPPCVASVDTRAAEFVSTTPTCIPPMKKSVRPCQATTKSWCWEAAPTGRAGYRVRLLLCVAVSAMREDGFETIMVNCNPETVSTDFNISTAFISSRLPSRMSSKVARTALRGDRPVRRANTAQSGQAA